MDITEASEQIKASDSISNSAPTYAMSRKSETRTYGATSNTITLKMDPQAKMGGGTMSALVTNQYERNFLLEAALNDLRFNEKKKQRLRFSGG